MSFMGRRLFRGNNTLARSYPSYPAAGWGTVTASASLCSTVLWHMPDRHLFPVTVTNDARGSKGVGSHARSF